MDNKSQHLEMIQGVVNRLAKCSFLLKGWSVILVSALFALSARDSRIYFILLAYFPSLAFWGLDGYYLWQERLYRALFDKVRRMNEDDIDFSMDTSSVRKDVDPWVCVTFSKTLSIFHGVIVATIILVTLIVIN
jgi:hypothetical protein